ncbi:MAG: drug/metabolite transporter (DMT)-like permease [Gammaproteobacteria bacterium]|jgi:drug/metabolite transporter (DMT)-like permease
MKDESGYRPALGYLAATLVMLIWASWLVASRSAAQSPLTIYDLAAMRYGISAIFAAPFVIYFKAWESIPIKRILVFSFLLSPFYILCVFNGFNYAPAAHGGIFMNGVLPAVTLLIGWLWLSEKASVIQLLGVALIFIGAVLAVIDGSTLSLADSWRGDLFFVGGALFFSGYLVIGRLWKITTLQILLCSSVINAILYVPIWAFFLPSGIAQSNDQQLLLQVLYQGLIPNLLGLLLVGYAIRQIGSASTAAFMAGVPALGTVLSMFLLDEFPGIYGWLSLLILTPGILMVAVYRRSRIIQ